MSQPAGLLRAPLLLCACLITPGAAAVEAICPDAELLSYKMVTDLCWRCVMPIRIMGASIGAGNTVPSAASNKKFCACEDGAGIPKPGFMMGMWEPARIIELSHQPFCMSALGGIVMDVGSQRTWGTLGHPKDDASDVAFYNYHYYAFPALIMLDLLVEDRCKADGYFDLDVMYMSELDPTWNDPSLAFFANPEAAAFANPVAAAACAVDAAAAAVGQPLDSMFWCAGSWGPLYPLTGFLSHQGDPPRDTSLLATRAVAALHRRGLAWKTMGDEAICRGQIYPMIPKSQYKMSMFYPVPETQSDHPIGRTTFAWGFRRNFNLKGFAFLYTLYRWNDCCVTF